MSTSYSPQTVTSGLVFTIDSTNRKSYFSGSSNWNDLSGNNYNGTFPNGIGFNTSNGGNLTFNGTNQYVNCGSSLSQSANFSISCWTKRNGIQPSAGGVICGQSGATPGYGQNYLLSISASASPVALFSQSSDSYKNVKSNTVILDDTWYYIVGTYDTVANVMRLYINGGLENSTSLTADPPTTGSQLFLVGASDGSSPGNWFKGSVSDVRVYNKTLSLSEIQQNFNATKKKFGL